MKNKILIATIILASSSVYADYNIGDVSGGEYKVYSETISRYGDDVRFVLGHMNENNSIDTMDIIVNCTTHRTIDNDYLPPQSVGREATDYVCDLTNDIE